MVLFPAAAPGLPAGSEWIIVVGALLLVVLMLFILVLLNRTIRQLQQGANRLAQGELSHRVSVQGPLPLAMLAESLNRMAEQLQDRLGTVVAQRNELEVLLASMAEGVLAIDLDQRLTNLNRAAGGLLGIEASAIGRSIQETVRHAGFQDFIAQTLAQDTAMESEFVLEGRDGPHAPRDLQAQSAILRNAQGERIGAVIVLHDVTRLRRLEAVRRDFVANVSHEIKTPVSAIKAAMETLLDENPPSPDDAQRFMQIAARQADRLGTIVEDLLSLARIEEQSGQFRDALQAQPLAPVLRAACETCQANADDKQMTLTLRCDAGLEAAMDPSLIEQAVVNLIDNAIKYSAERTEVLIIAEAHQGEVTVTVADHGRGIEPEHLPRVFERFYRTDKARSRALGGTGLGLSIVKHVAQVHGGRVSAESTPGTGSRFHIHLPPGSAR